jgi:hypothetical protein
MAMHFPLVPCPTCVKHSHVSNRCVDLLLGLAGAGVAGRPELARDTGREGLNGSTSCLLASFSRSSAGSFQRPSTASVHKQKSSCICCKLRQTGSRLGHTRAHPKLRPWLERVLLLCFS